MDHLRTAKGHFPTPREVEQSFLNETLMPVIKSIRATILATFATAPYNGTYCIDLGKVTDGQNHRPTGTVLRAACAKIETELVASGWSMQYVSDQRDGESLTIKPVTRQDH